MEWAKAVREAVRYMEDHMTEDITMNEVARHVNISPFYFNKGFSILCGYSITEYIRNRRMALAGNELVTSDITAQESCDVKIFRTSKTHNFTERRLYYGLQDC